MQTIIKNTKTDVILNTYALARASWLEDDFISSFVSLGASLINKNKYEQISSETFASDFEEEYGIELPAQPAIKLLSILQKRKLIIFEESMRSWKPNLIKLSKYDLTTAKNSLQKDIEKVYADIIDFSKENFKEQINLDNFEKS